MAIYEKYLITTITALLFVSSPSGNDVELTSKRDNHDVERLIDLTKKDIRDLETKIDSIIIAKSDTLKSPINGTIITQ